MVVTRDVRRYHRPPDSRSFWASLADSIRRFPRLLICSGCSVGKNWLDLVELFTDLALGDFDIITVLEIQL